MATSDNGPWLSLKAKVPSTLLACVHVLISLYVILYVHPFVVAAAAAAAAAVLLLLLFFFNIF